MIKYLMTKGVKYAPQGCKEGAFDAMSVTASYERMVRDVFTNLSEESFAYVVKEDLMSFAPFARAVRATAPAAAAAAAAAATQQQRGGQA